MAGGEAHDAAHALIAARPKRSAATARTPGAAAPTLHFRIRIRNGDVIAIGPGKIALLEAIDRTGSIVAAARELEMSYRRAWVLLDETNSSLARPVVESATGGHRGGGTRLTDAGRQVVATYRRIESEAAKRCQSDIRKLLGMLARH